MQKGSVFGVGGGLEGVGSVAELFATEVLAVVTGGEGFEGLGLDSTFLALGLGLVLEVLEHHVFAFGDEVLVEEALEGVEDGGTRESAEPAFGHGELVVGVGGSEHIGNSEDDELVSAEVVLGEHPAVQFEDIVFLHKFRCWLSVDWGQLA